MSGGLSKSPDRSTSDPQRSARGLSSVMRSESLRDWWGNSGAKVELEDKREAHLEDYQFQQVVCTQLVPVRRVVLDSCVVVITPGKLAEAGRNLIEQLCTDKYFANITVVAPTDAAGGYFGPGHQRVRFVNIDPSERPTEVAQAAQGAQVAFVFMDDGDDIEHTDRDAVIMVAESLKKAGVVHLHMVSAQGADPASYIDFLRVKGEAEREVLKVKFQRLAIYRPGYIRSTQAPSLGDAVGGVWAVPLDFFCPKDASIKSRTLAQGVVANATAGYVTDVKAVENFEILEHAGSSGDGWIPMEHVPELDTVEWDETENPVWLLQEEEQAESFGGVWLAMMSDEGKDEPPAEEATQKKSEGTEEEDFAFPALPDFEAMLDKHKDGARAAWADSHLSKILGGDDGAPMEHEPAP
eukprot:CAMPEP_0180161882 /NCGR_PEP_ID=MMETSP0986-20121125/28905_1 /TAXON_ID=697907 /ORGANISM="non described non described, Strain CCMP2293" /LENGTH=409 /DNA_ID=CAMNT_0022112285 /DNA_START=64 /DNA_END=1294 /DNA_ORIENTATION=+